MTTEEMIMDLANCVDTIANILLDAPHGWSFATHGALDNVIYCADCIKDELMQQNGGVQE